MVEKLSDMPRLMIRYCGVAGRVKRGRRGEKKKEVRDQSADAKKASKLQNIP